MHFKVMTYCTYLYYKVIFCNSVNDNSTIIMLYLNFIKDDKLDVSKLKLFDREIFFFFFVKRQWSIVLLDLNTLGNVILKIDDAHNLNKICTK